ncbi:MAG: alanine--glyoxylate aminotransferase family protein [candidate division WOR-3 bacterium]|nr:MAG: alanine--glyoxylate aminotransferase family protein [candidate division WOR-3 bacterium]
MDKYTLFTPGPVDVPDEVLKESGASLIYHREAKFADLYRAVAQGLQKIMYSSGKIFLFASSGTGGMEAACANILARGDIPVVAVCGKFGERWQELCTMYGFDPVTIKADCGKAIPPEKLESALQKTKKPAVVFTTLAETSTGVLNDIKAFGEITKKHGAILVVDGVAGIGADYCPQDDWHVDILVGASQKALMTPPGVAFIAVNDRASQKMQKCDLPRYYFNLQIYEKFLNKQQTPWTPAITILYALRRGIELILKKGLEQNFQLHREVAEYVRGRVKKMELEIFSEHPSNALTVVKMPEGITSTDIIGEVKEKHGILFANGQGEMRGKILRIGHMGNYTIKKMAGALDALEEVYNRRRQ